MAEPTMTPARTPVDASSADAQDPLTTDAIRAALPAFTSDASQRDAGYGEQWRFTAPPGTAPADGGVTVLVEYGLIRVAGKDAAAFLQGQLTNDVRAIDAAHAQASAYCSPKGRIIGTFWVWREAPGASGEAGHADGDAFLLACSRDLSSSLAKRLRMFVMRSKVRVEQIDHAVLLLGLVGRDAIDAAADVPLAGIVSLPGDAPSPARAMSPVALATLGDVVDALARKGLRWLDTDRWRALEVRSGIARINAATTERFVPQMVNFERTAGVSFTKGCYPGQEIVARTQYLGKAKRRMFLAAGSGPLPASGQDVHPAGDATGEPVGTVVLAAPDDAGGWQALFECRIDAADADTRIGESRLDPRPLPYPVVDAPAEAASPNGASAA
ncbi:MAG: folate-binding protein YgfZ [Lautropia sp.]